MGRLERSNWVANGGVGKVSRNPTQRIIVHLICDDDVIVKVMGCLD